jgi:acyl dehydratase
MKMALEAGEQMTIGPFTVDAGAAEAYLNAAGGDASFYEEMGATPPMAVAGRTLGMLIERLSMPPGSVHIGQELDFLDTAKPGEPLACSAKLARESRRGGWRILQLEFTVNAEERRVLAGRTTVMVPEEAH